MDLYHADIRLPEGFCLPNATAPLKWSNHAERARHNDRYGTIPHLNQIVLSGCSVIEVGLEGKRVCHLLLRFNHGQGDRDIVMALVPNRGKPWTVKTVWFNLRTDRHSTLDRSKYMR